MKPVNEHLERIKELHTLLQSCLEPCFQGRLPGLRCRVVIAGGAVRDALNWTAPKDYDVFLLLGRGVRSMLSVLQRVFPDGLGRYATEGRTPEQQRAQLQQAGDDVLWDMVHRVLPMKLRQQFSIESGEKSLATPWRVVPGADDDGWSQFLGETEFHGKPVQFIMHSAQSVYELLDTFDWNICGFAYGSVKPPGGDGAAPELVCMERAAACRKGELLRLRSMATPTATLDRGFNFRRRYGMTLAPADIVKLSRASIEELEAGREG